MGATLVIAEASEIGCYANAHPSLRFVVYVLRQVATICILHRNAQVVRCQKHLLQNEHDC